MAFRPSSLLVTVGAVLIMTLAAAETRGDDLRLRDGLVIKADQIWERGGEVWYRQGRLIRSVPKSEVVFPLVSPGNVAVGKTGQVVATLKRDQANLPSRAISTVRITFKDGTVLDADAVSESQEIIRYRLGTMQGFVERPLIKSIARENSTAPEFPADNQRLEFSTGHAGLDRLIAAEAARNAVDPLLVYLIMRQESGFNHRAISRAGARGLMQLMPATARMLGVRNIHDPKENVGAGARYVRLLLDRYAGDVNLTLAAYNAGEDAVARSGNRVPRYRETIAYVRKIGWAYYRARQ